MSKNIEKDFNQIMADVKQFVRGTGYSLLSMKRFDFRQYNAMIGSSGENLYTIEINRAYLELSDTDRQSVLSDVIYAAHRDPIILEGLGEELNKYRKNKKICRWENVPYEDLEKICQFIYDAVYDEDECFVINFTPEENDAIRDIVAVIETLDYTYKANGFYTNVHDEYYGDIPFESDRHPLVFIVAFDYETKKYVLTRVYQV